jgi:hypothetical protein
MRFVGRETVLVLEVGRGNRRRVRRVGAERSGR